MVSTDLKPPRYQAKHKVITDLFRQVPTKVEAEQFKLSQEKVDFFKQNGYLPNNKILNQEQLDQLRTSLEDIVQGKNPFKDELISGSTIEPQKGFAYFQGAW